MKTFDDIIIEVIILFGIIFALTIGVLRIFRINRYAISLPVAHIIFISFFSLIYYSNMKHDAMEDMVWGIPFCLDLPFSLIGIFTGITGKYAIPITLSIFGTIQYWLIGHCVDRYIARRLAKSNEKSKKESEGKDSLDNEQKDERSCTVK